jgi:hypothetical protein
MPIKSSGFGLALASSAMVAASVGCVLRNSAPTPLYTPIITPLEGTTLPLEAELVSIENLVAQPETYRDQFVEVRGINAGVYGKPDCSPYIGPPTEWMLLAEPLLYKKNVPINNPARIEVKNNFGGAISMQSDPATGHTITNPLIKKVAVWGWLRLYEGGVGCVFRDLQGTPIPKEIQRVWYVDAVKLQFLESIEVKD